jgi:hypothetical protein
MWYVLGFMKYKGKKKRGKELGAINKKASHPTPLLGKMGVISFVICFVCGFAWLVIADVIPIRLLNKHHMPLPSPHGKRLGARLTLG